MIEVECCICKKVVKRNAFAVKNNKRIFCSRECFFGFRRENKFYGSGKTTQLRRLLVLAEKRKEKLLNERPSQCENNCKTE
jgi:hypothetical protein